MTLDSYEKWSQDYQKACAVLDNREKAMDELAEKIEADMELLGVTGIEDKLQDGVPDAIAALRRARILDYIWVLFCVSFNEWSLTNSDINIWVLTGDKKETAINIGFSTKLLDSDMELITLAASDKSIGKEISAAITKIKGTTDQVNFYFKCLPSFDDTNWI